jgi:S1-C subfamily serine protease
MQDQNKEVLSTFDSTEAQRTADPDTPATASSRSVDAHAQTAPSPPPARPGRSGRVLWTAIALLLVLALLGVGIFVGIQIGKSGSNATGTPAAPSSSSFNTLSQQVAAMFRQSVVQINTMNQKGEGGLGSGTIIDSRGYIVTNYHVIEGAKQIQVELYSGIQVAGQLTGIDPPDDLAVIKITPPPHMAVARIGDSSQLKVAEYVMAIGNPLGVTQTVTSGIVSALGRNVPLAPGVVIVDAVQTDAAINPGNSGGALVDLQGDLIGVPTFTLVNPTFKSPASGLGFAVPSNRVKFIVPQIIQTGRVTNTGRAWLGVSTVTIDSELTAQAQLSVNQGALIVAVTPDSPGALAGLHGGDVIVQLGNTSVTSAQSLTDALLNLSLGNNVAVRIFRGNQQMTINVTLGEVPSTK